jgi:hypothetical protein
MQNVMDAASVPIKEDDDIEENSVESMFKIMMKKMDTVESTVDGMASKVDGAVHAAMDAKDGVQKMEVKIVTLQTEIEAERKSRETWPAGMEERFSAVEFAKPSEDVKPTDPEVDKKLKDIEKKLAGMNASDPWATWKGKGNKNPSAPLADSKGMDGENRSRTVTFGPFPEDT